MVLEFPVRVKDDFGETERLRQLQLPIALRQRMPVLCWAKRNQRLLTFGFLVFAVMAFSGAWAGGALVLDGPGISLYLRLVLDHLGAERMVPYWMPNLWGGAPVWAVTPSLPVFLLVPLATALGPAVAVKVGVLALQVFGGCGAYVLSRTLWRSYPAALLAGLLFALQPLIVAHGALAGNQPTLAVMATAPWLVWTLRKGLGGDGPGWLAVSGLLGGFAVLMQAEYALGLALLCACLVVVEAGRVGTGRNDAGLGRLLARAGAVVAIALGSTAYWLLPFATLGKSFVLSPPELVQRELINGFSDQVGRELGVFFGRSQTVTGAVGVNREGLLGLFFHMGWACLILSLFSVVVLSRRDRDGTLIAIFLSSTLGIWLSTGAVPLASSGPAARAQVVPFVVAGLAAGLMIGALLRPFKLGRWAPLFLGAALAFLFAAPYLTPFVSLQKFVPLFENIRFPRFYAVAPLALSLGAAYPVILAQDWAERHRGRSTPALVPAALSGAVALAVLGVFLVDAWPSRSYYRVRPPASGAAYREVAAALAQVPGRFRVSPTQIDPTAPNALLDTGHPLTVAWPHFLVSKQLWRLTAEPLYTPNAYRERAYGLLATGFQVAERPTDKGTATESVPAIDVITNPYALPMVRAYSHTVAMAGDELTPELAVALAHRNVGVFTGSPTASPALAATTVVDVRSTAPCDDDSGVRLDPALAGQLGVACGLHRWLSTLVAGIDLLNVGERVGGTFRATTDRLQGISAFLDRAPDRAVLALHEVTAAGALGPARSLSRAVGTDEYGLIAFTFDPIADSAGKEYAFVLSCPDCAADKVPRIVVGHAVDRPGNLLVGETLRRDRVAAFAPIYEPVATDPPNTTTLETTPVGPGRWRIRANGAAPALVVVAEAWFPGWEARIDGRRAPVVPADGGLVGVPVDAGDHVLTLEYHRPATALLGRVVTGATLLTVAALAIRRRRRRPAASSPPAVPPPRARQVVPPVPERGESPLLVARERPRREPPSEEVDWDEVVTPHRPGSADDHDDPTPSSPRPRPPGTARWPPEPF